MKNAAHAECAVLDLHFGDNVRAEAGRGEGTRGLGRVIVVQGMIIYGGMFCGRDPIGLCLGLGSPHGGEERSRLVETNQGRGDSRGAHEETVATTKPCQG